MSQHTHSVLFYEDESFFVDSVSSYILSALARRDAALVIATQAHIDLLSERLKKDSLPVDHFLAEGRLQFVDASRLLSRLLVGGWPDEARFRHRMGRLVRGKIKNFSSLSAFGEMVDMLWQSNRRDASVELERLWSGLREENPFTLECAYRVDPLDVQLDIDRFSDVCRLHDTTRLHPDGARLHSAFMAAVRQVVPVRHVEMLESWIANGGFRHENHVCESVVWLRRYMPELAGRVLALTRSLVEAGPALPAAEPLPLA